MIRKSKKIQQQTHTICTTKTKHRSACVYVSNLKILFLGINIVVSRHFSPRGNSVTAGGIGGYLHVLTEYAKSKIFWKGTCYIYGGMSPLGLPPEFNTGH